MDNPQVTLLTLPEYKKGMASSQQHSTSTTFTMPTTSGTECTISFTACAVERSTYLWVGTQVEGTPPRLEGVFAATPGYKGASGMPVGQSGPPSCVQLLVGGNEGVCDVDATESFARALSARTGKVVLLSYNVPDALVGLEGQSEIKRKALAFLLDKAV